MILYFFIFLPSTFFTVFGLSSLSHGFIITYSFILFINIILQNKKLRISASKLFFISISYFVLAISMFNVIVFYPNKKSLQISLILILFIFFALLYEKQLFLRIFTHFKKHSLFLVYFLMFLFFFSKYTDTLNYSGKHSIFIFSEPSHYLFSTSSLFFFNFVKGGKFVKISIYVFFILFLLLQNSLLCFVIILLLTILANRYYLYLLFGLCCLFIYINYYDYISYFTDRLTIFEISNNLSLLVYQDGFYSAFISLKNTFFSGYGVGNLGYVDDEISPFRLRINDIYGSKLNNFDGSFLASKIINEFGFFGILISCFALYFILGNLIRFFKYSSLYNCFNVSISFSFLIEFFLRGSSYFTFNVFLFLIVYSFYLFSKRIFQFYL